MAAGQNSHSLPILTPNSPDHEARQAILQSAGPSHCVVQFDCDECVITVTCKQVVRPPVSVVGGECWVNWSS